MGAVVVGAVVEGATVGAVVVVLPLGMAVVRQLALPEELHMALWEAEEKVPKSWAPQKQEIMMP
jgi:hypothetical protein